MTLEANKDGSFGYVINIINGGFDCCPSSVYKEDYGKL